MRKLDTTLGCQYASEDLLNYYKTGDLSEIDLTDDLLESPNKDSDYIKTLIKIADDIFYKDIEKINDEKGKENFDKKEDLNNIIKKYLIHFKLFIFFLIISILCIIGWIICFIYICFDCCCCNYCIKESIKESCIRTFLKNSLFLYFIIVFISILANFGNYFFGEYYDIQKNIQCAYSSFLKTFIFGEQKESELNWKGIDKAMDIFSKINYKIKSLNDNNKEKILEKSLTDMELKRNNFFQKLINIHKNFYEKDGITPLKEYIIDYQDNNNYYIEKNLSKFYLRKKYILDLIPLFGRYHFNNASFNGLLSILNDEFSNNYNGAKASMDKVNS